MMGTLGRNDWRWWLFNYRSPVFHDLFGTPPVKQCFIIRGYDWKFWVMFESLEHEHHAKPSSKFSWLSCLWFPSVSPRTSAKKDNLAGKGQPAMRTMERTKLLQKQWSQTGISWRIEMAPCRLPHKSSATPSSQFHHSGANFFVRVAHSIRRWLSRIRPLVYLVHGQWAVQWAPQKL